MSLPADDHKTAQEDTTDYLPNEQVHVRHPLAPSMMPGYSRIFDSANLDVHTSEYDICSPMSGTGSALLKSQNPGLLAIRNRSEKVPRVIPASVGRSASSMVKKPRIDGSSLLNRKPLGKLRDPLDIPALQTVQMTVETERAALTFREDPVAYFAKRKDGGGHQFIYLLFEKDPEDPDFSPYELRKVPFAETEGKDYFTMSSTGVTFIRVDGETETVSLDRWVSERASFTAIRKLGFFRNYWLWKPQAIWKNFVVQQRFRRLSRGVRHHPYFRNVQFVKHAFVACDMRETADTILKKFLLAFQQGKKYNLQEFHAANKQNIDELKSEYTEFLMGVQDMIMEMYRAISDPRLVQVKDSDFVDVQRRNPNLTQLMHLEKRKAYLRAKKTEAVNQEIMEIGAFIRMVDYMLLEALARSCEECWKIAEANVSTDVAAIFQVEVLFDDDGKVIFTPDLDALQESVSRSLKGSLEVLNMLPRLLMSPVIRPLLRDNGLDVAKLLETGPEIVKIIHASKDLGSIEKHILDKIAEYYGLALAHSQQFCEFYPIFLLGKTWNPMDYVLCRSGQPYTGTLKATPREGQEDEFLFHIEDEPIANFEKIREDLKKLQEYETMVASLRLGTVKGALYIDSRKLRSILMPIPTQSIKDLYELLHNLSQMKISSVGGALKYYGRLLKQEPKTLEEFVEYCQLIERTVKFAPRIQDEIKLVDDIYALFDEFGVQHNSPNPLLQLFAAFKVDQQNAGTIKDLHAESCLKALKDLVRETERRIDHFSEKATNIPISMKETDVGIKLPAAEKLCVKIDNLAPKIQDILLYQKVMGVDLNNFAVFQDVVAAAAFAVSLYKAIGKWNGISDEMTTKPFTEIVIDDFKKNITELKEEATHLQAEATSNYPVLNELVTRINETFPYLEELEMLSKGKMQVRHWNALFEACGLTVPYNAGITISDLLSLGVLKMRDKIEKITATSHGESELEQEFQQISNHWNKVQLPLVEQAIKTDENLLLGPTDKLVSEIFSTLADLQRMLSLPFVQGIREAVNNLSNTLENITLILDAWKKFQGNWVVLSALFALEEARTVLPHQANRFAAVQRKWVSIARHTLKDTRLFSVCSFPSLLNVLTENNESMQSILAALGKFLDTKRVAMPRLFFLSNEEVLALCTTNVSSLFTQTITKLFMFVKSIDCRDGDVAIDRNSQDLIQNIQRLKIYGMVGEDGDSIQLTKYVSCNAGLEVWLAQLIEGMKATVLDLVCAGIAGCKGDAFVEWILGTPAYIVATCLNIVFSEEVEDAFNGTESRAGIGSFSRYEKIITQRIEQLASALSQNLTSTQILKVSTIMAQLISMRSKAQDIGRLHDEEVRRLKWQETLKTKLIQSPNVQIVLECGEGKWEHGCEYWGKVPAMIQPVATAGKEYQACLNSFIQQATPLLIGSAATGKLMTVSDLACQFGSFLYVARPFPEAGEFLLSRVVIGAAVSGSWSVFTDIEKMSHHCLSYLFDTIRSLNTAQAAGNHRTLISGKPYDLNSGCRILLTSHYLPEENDVFPAQLRAIVRPIHLLEIGLEYMTAAKLQTLGFKEQDVLAKKLVGLVSSFVELFPAEAGSNGKLAKLMAICDQAAAAYRQLESCSVSEELAVAGACYQYLQPMLSETQGIPFSKLLHATFGLADSDEDLVEKLKAAYSRKIDEIITNLVEDELRKHNTETPTQYLVENVTYLYHLLETTNCVIICGPPSSGKTSVIQLLTTILEKEEMRTAEFVTLKPFNSIRLFHDSDKPSRVYGTVYNDLTLGYTWQYGLIHATLYKLLGTPSEKASLLHFDGPLNQFFERYITEFLGESGGCKCGLNSLDSYRFENFKVVIETDSLANASPALLGKARVLSLHNMQTTESVSSVHPSCELVHPTLPFARAQEFSTKAMHLSSIPIIRSIFCEVAPTIVKRVYHTKNIVCYSEADTRMEYGNVILSEVLPMYAAALAFSIIDTAKVDCTDDDKVTDAIVLAFFRIFSSIMDQKEASSFDSWLRTTYEVEMPPDWVGFSVPDHFWNIYQRPSLQSMRLMKGQLVPVDFQRINDKPLMQMRSESQLPFILDDVTVIHAQMLPVLETASVCLGAMKHLIIHGAPDSGKSSFLRVLFDGNSNITPLIIPASRFQTTESLLTFITSHTNLISKARLPSWQIKKFALVFENVDETHTFLMEFIRMLIITQTIPEFSVDDQKTYETHLINNFIVVVTTRDYSKLPSRFVSHFLPVKLESMTSDTAQFVANQILRTYGYTEDRAESIIKLAASVFQQYPPDNLPMAIIKLSYLFCHIPNKTNQSDHMKLILYQVYHFSLHKAPFGSYAEKLKFLCKGSTDDYKEQKAVDDFIAQTELCYPNVDLTRDMKSFTVSAGVTEERKIKDELAYALKVFNTNSNEKLVIRFASHVIRQVSMIHTALGCPGRGVVLIGGHGSGRYSLTRFVANILECDFVNIAPPTPDELLVPSERVAIIQGVIRDVITNASVHQKRTVIFLRHNKHTLMEKEMLCNLISQRDFMSFFSKSALEELYVKFTGNHQMNYEHRLLARKQISNMARVNVKVVIAVDKDSGEADRIMSHRFDKIVLDNDSDEIFKSVARDALDGLATKKVIGTFSDSLVTSFVKFAEIARKKMVNFTPNAFYDFADCVAHFAAADYQDIRSMNDNIQSALEFLDRLENESHQIEKKLDSLAPTLQRLQMDSETLQSSYTTRKEAIEQRKVKLDDELEIRSADVAQLKEKYAQIEAERDKHLPRVEETMKLVEGLTDNDIETIRITASDPMPSLRLLLEIFCLILDRPASYERAGQKLLMDPHFVQTILNRVQTTKLTSQLLETIEPYFEKEELNPAELESIAPSLRVLYDWIESVCKTAILSAKVEAQKKELDDKELMLNEFIEEMNLEIASIKQVEASLENESKALEASKAAREQMEKEYHQVDNRKKSIDSIFRGIESFTEKWKGETADFSRKRQKIIGNALFFSFCLAFCGSMDIRNRKQALEQVAQEIKDIGLDSDARDPVQFIADRFISSRSEDATIVVDPMFTQMATIDTYHVRSTLRTPLLIDPDGLMLNHLNTTVKSKRMVVVSQDTSSLDTVIASAIGDGKLVILQDADYLHPVIAPLLQMSTYIFEEEATRELRIGSRVTTWDPRFKLILVSTTADPASLPQNLLARVTVIDMTSSSLETTHTLFENTFMEFFCPELLPRILEMKDTERQKKQNVSKYERDTLDILADIITTQKTTPDYDYLSDDETISELLKSKESYFKATKVSTDFSSLQEEVKKALQPYRSHIKRCQIFWEVISRVLSKVLPDTRFSFFSYQKHIASLFVNEGLHSGNLTAEQHTALRNSITSMTLQFVFPSIPIREAIFFAFMSSYAMKESEQKMSRKDLESVVHHMRDESKSMCDLRSNDQGKGDVFEHLRFTNIVNMFKFIHKFCTDEFGQEFLNPCQPFQVDSVVSNSATIPSIVVASPQVNPTVLIHQLVTLRCRTDNFDTVSLSTDLEVIRNTKKVIVTALNRGNWVLVHYSKPTRAAGDMLADVFSQMTSTSVNTNFRLIILCSSLKYLSPSMVAKSKRVNVEEFPSIRHSMVEMFNHFSSNIRSANNPRAMKKFAYLGALLLSLVNYRRTVEPSGFNCPVRPSDVTFRDYLEYLRVFIDAGPADLPPVYIDHLCEHVNNVVFAYVPDVWDWRVLKSYVSGLFPGALEEGFSAAKGSPESSKWVIPADGPISNYMQIVQQLPIFANTDILQMSPQVSDQIRNWNLSQWIVRPFLAYIPPREKGDDASANIGAQLDNMLMLLPEKITISEDAKFQSPVSQVLLSEIDKLNTTILLIRKTIGKAMEEVNAKVITKETEALVKGSVPLEWKLAGNYLCGDSVQRFTSFLIQRHALIMKWLQEGKPEVIDASLFDDVRAFMMAMLIETALTRKEPVDSLTYEFSVTDKVVDVPEPGFLLTNVSLVGCEIQDGGLCLPDATKPTKIVNSTLICKIVKASEKEGEVIVCPLYRTAFVPNVNAIRPVRETEGLSENLVWEIKVSKKAGGAALIKHGASLYCRLPEQL